MQIAFLSILLVIAALGPVLTFTRLFQVKEWRLDRLREHLRSAGIFRQLFGWLRPALVAVGFVMYVIFSVREGDMVILGPEYAVWIPLGLLAWFSLLRFVIGKQKRPVWTKKAFLVVCLSLFLLLAIGLPLAGWIDQWFVALSFMLLPLFAFLAVGAAWGLLLPLDLFLKKRVFEQARAMRARYPHLTVVGITGSVGKTTTKEMLAHILSDRSVLATPAHVNSEMGVASFLIHHLKPEHQLCIIEMGAYRKGEIAMLCSVVSPQIGVITYIGNQHLALFGSREALCMAKGELFKALPPLGHAFLNADGDYCDTLMALAACPVSTVSTGGHATYEAFDIQESPEGVSFTVRDAPFHVPIHGTHQVTNIVLAAAVAEVLGVPLAESAKRLSSFAGLPQTFEKKIGAKGQVVLDDTHNASVPSFRAAIEWARVYPAESKILVTSGLIELGKAEQYCCQELGLHARDVFQEVIFLNKRCAQYFEQGYGRTVFVPRKKKFSIALSSKMLIVCEGRMPESVVERLLA